MGRFHKILNSVSETIVNAARKGPEFVAALPKQSKEQLGIKASDEQRVMFPEIEYEDDRLSLISEDDEDEMEMEDEEEEDEAEEEMNEYKQDFYNMSVGSLLAVMTHAKSILDNLQNPNVKENLTAPHLQGMIAVLEDHMRSVHDFVMFVSQESEDSEAASKPGLWENIRKKKEKMGKKYKPAKPGDKDRPNPDAWKRAQG